nr:hypothetical protein [Tanacetum cinerariifolium]
MGWSGRVCKNYLGEVGCTGVAVGRGVRFWAGKVIGCFRVYDNDSLGPWGFSGFRGKGFFNLAKSTFMGDSKLAVVHTFKCACFGNNFLGFLSMKSFSFLEPLNIIVIRCGMSIATICFIVLCDVLRVSSSLSSFITIAKGGSSSIFTFFNLPVDAEIVLEAEELLLPITGAEEGTFIVIHFKVLALNVDFDFRIDLIVFGLETGTTTKWPVVVGSHSDRSLLPVKGELKFLFKMPPKRSEGEELEYPFFEGDGSSFDEWRDYGMSGEDNEGPLVFDDDQYEEELMPVYDTTIEDVIEEEEGFVRKGGFGGKEDNIEDVVVVVNDLCSLMI